MKAKKLYDGIRKAKKDIGKLVESKKSKDVVVILIAGGSASGKTSLIAKRIMREYRAEALLLSMDNYYIGREFVLKNNLTFDEPAALDLDLFRSHLKKLKSGRTIHAPMYDFKTGERLNTHEVIEPKRVIIVEGLFALEKDIAKLGDYRIFVDLGTHGRVLRRIFRDVERTGDSAGEILKYFSQVVEPKNTEHIEPTKKQADIIIENKYIPFVESRSAKVKETQLKFKVDGIGFDEIGQKINSLGGFYVGEVTERDYFLMNREKKLKKSDEVMRVRNIGFGKYLLSYRGPKAKSKEYEKRYGVNFFIDYETLEAFKKIYGHFQQVLIKKRQNYFLGGLIISLDRFENDDLYIDFRFEEGTEDRVLKPFLKELGMKRSDGIKKSYFEFIQ